MERHVERLLAEGVPVIVGTGAQNPKRAAALAAHAKAAGAQGLMIIPRVLSRGSSAAGAGGPFAGILEAAVDLPSVIYNSPYYGFEPGRSCSSACAPATRTLVGFKEFGGRPVAHLRGRAHHRPVARHHPDGRVDTQVVHGYVNCGARGAITGIGNVLPRECCTSCPCGDGGHGRRPGRRRATELDAALAILSSFDEGTDIVLYYKYLMVLEGNPEYELHFNASDALSPDSATTRRRSCGSSRRGTRNGLGRARQETGRA